MAEIMMGKPRRGRVRVRSRNPRRRRRRKARASYRPRRRNPSWVPAYAQSTSASAQYNNPYWVPSYAHNPSAVGAITEGFQPKVLTQALPVVGGALGNAWLTGMISRTLPDFLATGPGNFAVGLASAGVLGAGAGALAPRYAGPVFLGGVIEVMTRVVRRYVMPLVGGAMSGLGVFNLWQQDPQLQGLGRNFNLWQQDPKLQGMGEFNLWQQQGSLGDQVAAAELTDILNYPQTPTLNYPTGGYLNPVDDTAGMELAYS